MRGPEKAKPPLPVVIKTFQQDEKIITPQVLRTLEGIFTSGGTPIVLIFKPKN